MIKVEDKVRCEMQQGMFGLFFEDINYALDGGLSAEMIENRSFEFFDCGGSKCNWYKKFDGLYGWSTDRSAKISIGTAEPVSRINPHYLVMNGLRAGAIVTNKAYDGVFLKKGMGYTVSLYARADSYIGRLDIEIRQTLNTAPVIIAVSDQKITGTWQKIEYRIEADRDIDAGAFCIAMSEPGIVNIDFVSMKPDDAVCGVFRRDLADMLKDMRPGFLRFPGGCIVEGNTLDNMYKWKLTVGDPINRKANWNRWAVHENHGHGPFSHYNQTYAVGYYEYFLLCEYIGAMPLPVCNVGMACQYESNEVFELEDEIFMQFVRDAIDLVEFANGPADSKWGSLRAQMGHPEPFGLQLLGIGNEQWETPESRFFDRYRIFEKKIHEVYPDILLIGSAGPDVTSEHYRDAWKFYHKEIKKNPNFTFAVDEHYYVSPDWMCENSHFYDNYPRDIAVFAGEYAAHDGPGSREPVRNTLRAAVSEAAFMTGLERNSDVVRLASYAPLFARVGYTQWAPDMIWFDAKEVCGSPSYYVQKIFSTLTGPWELQTSSDNGALYIAASHEPARQRTYLKVVNPSATPIADELVLPKAQHVIVTTLTGAPDAYNTPDNPFNVYPEEKLLEMHGGGKYVFAPMSVTVFEF